MYEFDETDREAFKNLAETGKMNVQVAQAFGEWYNSLEDDIDTVWNLKSGYRYPNKYEIDGYGVTCIQEGGDYTRYHSEFVRWDDIINNQEAIERLKKEQEEKRKEEERQAKIAKERAAKAIERREREELVRLKQKYEGNTQ